MPLHALSDHIYRHPQRLFATVLTIVALGWLAAGIAVVITLDNARQGRIENCRAINELSRKIYITAADMGVDRRHRLKFLPREDCDSIP